MTMMTRVKQKQKEKAALVLQEPRKAQRFGGTGAACKTVHAVSCRLQSRLRRVWRNVPVPLSDQHLIRTERVLWFEAARCSRHFSTWPIANIHWSASTVPRRSAVETARHGEVAQNETNYTNPYLSIYISLSTVVQRWGRRGKWTRTGRDGTGDETN